MEEWSKKDEAERRCQLDICKSKSGEYLPAGHGKGSWATTYSNEFVAASAKLWLLHNKNGSSYPQYAMARDFQSLGIRSCRGATMTAARVEYLYKSHLRALVSENGKTT
ncbi:hypothetical protein RB2150_06058 [Rhodobacterales bacterium HTCC2150]|nr:hypothetical protein RB2150_06058 [Rhodobacterales bacterium HTCC2150] [Rhodobacteraceae bacterium HTCC2150]